MAIRGPAIQHTNLQSRPGTSNSLSGLLRNYSMAIHRTVMSHAHIRSRAGTRSSLPVMFRIISWPYTGMLCHTQICSHGLMRPAADGQVCFVTVWPYTVLPCHMQILNAGLPPATACQFCFGITASMATHEPAMPHATIQARTETSSRLSVLIRKFQHGHTRVCHATCK